ncbi:hypothetical protein GCM10007160_18520 [Litchfieldella qijiaojingensis]|uniref:DUF3606 domain-containing protein n=1 Tax=Litchfieldella qijiaojingensis TaxID=980347 RepID=A0ABQ2YSX4_9GAMM|nr:hypothetical protein GCM10007160_18520 [Halomonas qijiaojingensis]
MTEKQRQHWEHQQRKAERLARIYGMGDPRIRELRIRAAERLDEHQRRAAP